MSSKWLNAELAQIEAKAAQDVYRDISEPPQTAPKSRRRDTPALGEERRLQRAARESHLAQHQGGDERPTRRRKDVTGLHTRGAAPRTAHAVAATPKNIMPLQRPQSATSTRSARSASGDSHRSTSTGASRLRADHVWLQPLPGVGNAEQIAAIQAALSPSKADARLSTATPVKPTRSQRRSSNETPRQRRPATAPSGRRGPPSPECLSPEKFALLSHPSSGAPEVDAFTMKRMQSPLRDRDVKGRQRRAEATPSPVIQQKKLREEAIARRPSQIQQRQLREQSQQMRRAARDDATQTEPAKKKTRKKPVPELQLESPATEDPLQAVVAGREEPTRTSVNLTRPRTASVETPPQGYTSWETLVGKDDLGSLYEANRRLSCEDLIKTYRARPSTAPRPGSRYAYLKKKGSIHTPGRIFHGNHWLRGRHVEAVAEGDPSVPASFFFPVPAVGPCHR